MKAGVRGIATGVLGLVVLDLLVTAQGRRVTGLFAVPAAVARWLIDPAVPLIPDLRHTKTSTSNAAGGSTLAPGGGGLAPLAPGRGNPTTTGTGAQPAAYWPTPSAVPPQLT